MHAHNYCIIVLLYAQAQMTTHKFALHNHNFGNNYLWTSFSLSSPASQTGSDRIGIEIGCSVKCDVVAVIYVCVKYKLCGCDVNWLTTSTVETVFSNQLTTHHHHTGLAFLLLAFAPTIIYSRHVVLCDHFAQ